VRRRSGRRADLDVTGQLVELVALGEDGAVDERHVSRGDVAGVFGEQGLHADGRAGEQGGPVVGGRTGQDAVVVGGKALRLHERFASAVGAGGEVAVRGGRGVVGGDDGLGLLGHLVDTAPSVVGDLFRMVQSPPCVVAIGEVAGIGAGGGAVAVESAGHAFKVDLASEASIADALKAVVPVGDGEPDFDLDIGIVAGSGLDFDAAESGELFVERDLLIRSGGARRRGERAGGDDFCSEDVGVVKLELLEVGAAAVVGGLGDGGSGEQEGGR
jgi:hypothetical protein